LIRARDLPIGGLTNGQTYYVVNPQPNTFQLALTQGECDALTPPANPGSGERDRQSGR
jgi:hypothetical protein